MNQTQNCSWTQNPYPRSSQRVCMDHQKGAFQEQKHLTGGDGARAPPHPRALCGSLLSCGSRILCVSANWARSILAPRWDGSGHAWTDDSENHEPGEKKGARMCVCVLLAFILFSQPPLSSSHGAATDGENVMFQPKKTRFASHFDGVMSLPWANWAVAVKAGRNERRKHRTTLKEGGSCQLNPPSHKACSEWRGCGCSAWTHADLRRKHPPTHARSVGRWSSAVQLRRGGGWASVRFPSPARRGLTCSRGPQWARVSVLTRPTLGWRLNSSPLLFLWHFLPGPSASMAEASLSVSVPAWRLRTDAEIGGGIAKLKGANLKNGNINGRAADCTLWPELPRLLLGICICACASQKTWGSHCACVIYGLVPPISEMLDSHI